MYIFWDNLPDDSEHLLRQLTVWFPVHLRQTILAAAPKVDTYTELGTPSNNTELNREYQRVLDRDKNPLQFLYHGGP